MSHFFKVFRALIKEIKSVLLDYTDNQVVHILHRLILKSLGYK